MDGISCLQSADCARPPLEVEFILPEETPVDPKPPQLACSPELYESLLAIQRQLGDVLDACHCPGAEVLPGTCPESALRAENLRLKARIDLAEGCAVPRHGCPANADAHEPTKPGKQSSPLWISAHMDVAPHGLEAMQEAVPPSGTADCQIEIAAQNHPLVSSLETAEPPSLRFREAPSTLSRQSARASSVIQATHSTPSIAGRMTSTMSSPPVFVGAPRRAFVINVRRLINAQELLSLLHDLIKDTAIAALTLVNAGSEQQLRTTLVFLACTIMIFIIHDRKWDTLDISDFGVLLPLVADDDVDHQENPNRLLKAVSFSQSKFVVWLSRFLHLFAAFMAIFSWLVCVRSWTRIESDDAARRDVIDEWCDYLVNTGDDVIVLAMQVSVGTLMLFLHWLFEALHFNETCGVMPRTTSGAIWDPRTDGLPLKYRVLGLPSMWFTSAEALEDIKLWIDKAKPTARVAEIHPEEIAFYALSGDDERRTVQRALSGAKLFNGQKRQFLYRAESSEPESLNIELCFFDSHLQTEDCPFPGEFLCLLDDDADSHQYRGSLVTRTPAASRADGKSGTQSESKTGK